MRLALVLLLAARQPRWRQRSQVRLLVLLRLRMVNKETNYIASSSPGTGYNRPVTGAASLQRFRFNTNRSVSCSTFSRGIMSLNRGLGSQGDLQRL